MLDSYCYSEINDGIKKRISVKENNLEKVTSLKNSSLYSYNDNYRKSERNEVHIYHLSKIENNIKNSLSSILPDYELTILERKLITELNDEKELFLKSSYPHTRITLETATTMIHKLLNKTHGQAEEKQINKLIKYIESFYHRVAIPLKVFNKLDGVSSEEINWRNTLKLTEKTLTAVGEYLEIRYNNSEKECAYPSDDLVDIVGSWCNAVKEFNRKVPDNDLMEKNKYHIKSVLRNHVNNQKKDLNNYKSSCNLGSLYNVFYSAKPGTKNFESLKNIREDLELIIIDNVSKSLALVNKSDNSFPLYHLRIAMNVYAHLERSSDQTSNKSLVRMDNQLLKVIRDYRNIPLNDDLREEINVLLAKYLDDTGRNHQDYQNNEFYGFVKKINEDSVLSHELTINNNYKLRIQDKFKSEEFREIGLLADHVTDKFHSIFGKKPVSDDNSKPLEIIIMKDLKNYKRFGNYPFRIDTNNGGIYIEGDPRSTNNQPRIFVYVKNGEVHNFSHEIVHYLDGRFNKYGHAGHVPSEKITWWSEGVAEYLAKDRHNSSDKESINNIPVNKRPLLRDIVDIDVFSANGHSDRLYLWPYLVHKFLNSSPELRNIRDLLVKALRHSDRERSISEYSQTLEDFTCRYQTKFNEWLGS